VRPFHPKRIIRELILSWALNFVPDRHHAHLGGRNSVHDKQKRQWEKPKVNSFGDAKEVLRQFAADGEWAKSRALEKLIRDADREQDLEHDRSKRRAAGG
jgi:hypothetical protein